MTKEKKLVSNGFVRIVWITWGELEWAQEDIIPKNSWLLMTCSNYILGSLPHENYCIAYPESCSFHCTDNSLWKLKKIPVFVVHWNTKTRFLMFFWESIYWYLVMDSIIVSLLNNLNQFKQFTSIIVYTNCLWNVFSYTLVDDFREIWLILLQKVFYVICKC